LEKLELRLNEEKSRIVEAEKETFDFLGFTYRRVWNRAHTKRVTIFYPSKRSQKRLRDRVRKTLNPMAPVRTVDQIQRTNQVVRGWVNYFWIGNSTEVFHDIRWYVEKKLRHVLERKAHRHGYGWKRYDHAFLYRKLGLFDGYRVRWRPSPA
jgi:RNA-directed DNA polymerase